MTSPMRKLIASVSEYMTENASTTISPTILLAIIEHAKILVQEEQILLKRAFVMGAKCTPEKAEASAEIFYKSNFENHERKNQKASSKRSNTTV